jgi:hypothetical protein
VALPTHVWREAVGAKVAPTAMSTALRIHVCRQPFSFCRLCGPMAYKRFPVVYSRQVLYDFPVSVRYVQYSLIRLDFCQGNSAGWLRRLRIEHAVRCTHVASRRIIRLYVSQPVSIHPQAVETSRWGQAE